jgi:hypothetical protein
MEIIETLASEEQLRKQVEIIYQEVIKKPEVVEALALLDKLPSRL